MGSGFLILGDSIDVVRFPGCLTLSDWCVVRSKDGDVQCFSERMSWLVERRFWSEEKGLSPGCLAQGASARDTERDGCGLRAIGLPRMFGPFAITCQSQTVGNFEIAGIQVPIRGLLPGARTDCSIPSGGSRCVEGGVIFVDWWSG